MSPRNATVASPSPSEPYRLPGLHPLRASMSVRAAPALAASLLLALLSLALGRGLRESCIEPKDTSRVRGDAGEHRSRSPGIKPATIVRPQTLASRLGL